MTATRSRGRRSRRAEGPRRRWRRPRRPARPDGSPLRRSGPPTSWSAWRSARARSPSAPTWCSRWRPSRRSPGTYVDWEGRPRPFGKVLRESNALPDVRVLQASPTSSASTSASRPSSRRGARWRRSARGTAPAPTRQVFRVLRRPSGADNSALSARHVEAAGRRRAGCWTASRTSQATGSSVGRAGVRRRRSPTSGCGRASRWRSPVTPARPACRSLSRTCQTAWLGADLTRAGRSSRVTGPPHAGRHGPTTGRTSQGRSRQGRRSDLRSDAGGPVGHRPDSRLR